MARKASHESGEECSRPGKQHVQMPWGGNILDSSRKWKVSHCGWNTMSQGEIGGRWEYKGRHWPDYTEHCKFLKIFSYQRLQFSPSSHRGRKVTSDTVERLSRRLKRRTIRVFNQNTLFPPDLLSVCHMFVQASLI